MMSKNEDWCWAFDPYYKAKARVSLFVVECLEKYLE